MRWRCSPVARYEGAKRGTDVVCSRINCSYRRRRLLDTKVAAGYCSAARLHTGNTSGEPPTADVLVVARFLQCMQLSSVRKPMRFRASARRQCATEVCTNPGSLDSSVHFRQKPADTTSRGHTWLSMLVAFSPLIHYCLYLLSSVPFYPLSTHLISMEQ
jgi:hypothetical protein